MAIPVIDFSKLQGKERKETLAQIANGCQEWGFFQLVNHGIPVELLERVKRVCSESYKEREEAFNASDPVRLLNKIITDDAGDNEEERERLKDMDWEDFFTLQDGNKWPSSPADFSKTMEVFRTELKKLAEKVMDVMDENLGLEKGYIKRAFSGALNPNNPEEHKPFFGTKVSHYPSCPRPDLTIGLRAHTDAGGIILLFQDDKVGGLQILKDGHWIDVQPLENAIVINTGDQIEVLSNGMYKSVWHRVLATTYGNRRSIASFYNPSYKAVISPATPLVKVKAEVEEEEGNDTYPKFIFGDYMDVYIKQKFLPKEPRFQAVKAV